MILILPAGSSCILDNKDEVVIVKPFNKLGTKHVVETANREVILVETSRLRALVPTQTDPKTVIS